MKILRYTPLLLASSLYAAEDDITILQRDATNKNQPLTINGTTHAGKPLGFNATTGALEALSITGTGSVVKGTSPTFTTSALFGSAGVSISDDGDGAITFLGLGNGFDEALTLNLDDTANTGTWSSSTGLTDLTFSGIDINANELTAATNIVMGSTNTTGGGSLRLLMGNNNVNAGSGAQNIVLIGNSNDVDTSAGYGMLFMLGTQNNFHTSADYGGNGYILANGVQHLGVGDSAFATGYHNRIDGRGTLNTASLTTLKTGAQIDGAGGRAMVALGAGTHNYWNGTVALSSHSNVDGKLSMGTLSARSVENGAVPAGSNLAVAMKLSQGNNKRLILKPHFQYVFDFQVTAGFTSVQEWSATWNYRVVVHQGAASTAPLIRAVTLTSPAVGSDSGGVPSGWGVAFTAGTQEIVTTLTLANPAGSDAAWTAHGGFVATETQATYAGGGGATANTTAAMTSDLAAYLPLAGGTMTDFLRFSGTTHPGIHLNNLTTAERDAMTPLAGYLIYNTDNHRVETYDGTDAQWETVGGGGGGGDALTTDPLSQFAATTSAELRGVLSDETGTGAAVFAGSPTFTGQVLAPSGSVSAPGVSFSGDTNSGIYLAADNDMRFATNGIERMKLTTNGLTQVSVGVGTLSTNNTLFLQPWDMTTTGTTVRLAYGTHSGTTSHTAVMVDPTMTETAGTHAVLKIAPTYNQASGTSANTDLLINRTATAVGSGEQLSIDAQVGGTSHFKVSAAGAVTAAGEVTADRFVIGSDGINSQTGTTYTLLASDNGKVITLTNAGSITVTVPAGLAVGFSAQIIQGGAGTVTFSASGTTVNSFGSLVTTAGQYAAVSIVAPAADTFILAGNLQ